MLKCIRDEGRSIRVAVASGTTDLALIDEARRLQAELVLIKPIDVNVLLAWLNGAG